MIGYVYITTNLINQKQYIGLKTSSTFNPKYLGSGKLLKKAINKYGKENFKVEILEECESIEELRDCERKWIKYYNAQKDSNFYNIAEGGQWGNNINGMTPEELEQYKKLLSEKVKQSYITHPDLIQQRKIDRQNMAGKIEVSEEDRYNRSERLKKRWEQDYDAMLNMLHKSIQANKENGTYENMWKIHKHPWKGRKHSEESKKKISEHTDNHGVNNPNAKSGVILLNNKVIFEFELTKEIHPYLENLGFLRKERREMLKGKEIRGYKIQREGATTIENTQLCGSE